MKTFNIIYKIEKWNKFGKITQFDDGNMSISTTEKNIKQLLESLSKFEKSKEINGEKYYTLIVKEDDGKYTKEQNNNNVTLKSDDFVPF